MDDIESSMYLKDKAFAEPEEDIYFLLARNGLFKITKTFFFKASTYFFVPLQGKKLEELRKHKVGLELCLPKKIPFWVYEKSLDFFRRRYKAWRCEALGIIYWDEKKEDYKLVIPKNQKGDIYRVLAEIGLNPNNTLRIGTIHSHGEIRAGHSGTDDEDERYDDGLHITMGDIEDEVPSISCSVVVDGQRFMVAKEDVFENKPDLAKPADESSAAAEEQPKKVEPKLQEKDTTPKIDTRSFLIPTH